jgi:hypothetical protein
MIFVVIFISGSFAFPQEEQKDEGNFPKFIPYVSEQNNLQTCSVKIDIEGYWQEQPAHWLSVDPMANKYPGWSPYNYTSCNPIRFIDLVGMAPSTYTDEDGNVTKITNDGKTDIYRQNNNGNVNYDGQKYEHMGKSVDLLSFSNQDNPYNSNGTINIGLNAKINFGSTDAGNMIQSSLNEISPNLGGFVNYALNAGNGEKYDIKLQLGVYSGSQIGPGLYASGRDAGNILAGAAANKAGLDYTTAMTGFGSLQMANNSKPLGAVIFSTFMMANPSIGSGMVPNFGESQVSHNMQSYGYNIYGK